MIDHITIGVSDLQRSRDFYLQALAPLGFDETNTSDVLPSEIEFGSAEKMDFAISTDYGVGAPVHVAFAADSIEQVHAFHAAALAAGGREHGPPRATSALRRGLLRRLRARPRRAQRRGRVPWARLITGTLPSGRPERLRPDFAVTVGEAGTATKRWQQSRRQMYSACESHARLEQCR
jgi:catechol 2,3-dioxygenase-like lactoylglutathione lyase family enzyme